MKLSHKAVAGVYKTTARTTRYTSGLISSYCHMSQRELMLGFGGGVKMTNRARYDKWQQHLKDTYQNEIHDCKCLPLSIIFSVTAIAPVRTESQAKSKTCPDSIFHHWQKVQDKVAAETKSSATLSLGRIEHSNSSGCLENRTLSLKWYGPITWTHMTIPRSAVTAALTGISCPFSSFAFVTLNTVSTDEITMKIVASTK